jgi:hypothetical protein
MAGTILGRGGSRPGETYWMNKQTKPQTTYKPQTVQTPKTTSEDLTKYSSDYKAEIDRRSAINPNDPTISQLTSLRNQKLASQQVETAPSYLGNGTSDTGGGTSTSSTSNEYGNILGAINDYGSDQNALMLQNLRAAFDQSENEYNAQKSLIQQEAAGMRNKVDTGYYQSLPELYRAMEAGGQQGGENITGMVGLNTIRQEGQNQANLYEANQLRNIENAILGIGTQRAQAEAEGTMGINADVFSAKLSALKDAMAQATADRNTAKADFNNTIGAFSDNYQAEINRLQQLMGMGQTTDRDGVSIAYKINALNAERNQKIANQQAAEAEAAQSAEQNALAWARLNKSGSSGATSSSLSYDEAFAEYQKGNRSPAVLRALNIQ